MHKPGFAPRGFIPWRRDGARCELLVVEVWGWRWGAPIWDTPRPHFEVCPTHPGVISVSRTHPRFPKL